MILQEIGCTLESYTEEKLYEYMIKKVNAELSGLSSCWMVDRIVELDSRHPTVTRPTNLSAYQLKCYYELFFMNFGLGNRAPLQGYMKATFCPLCKGRNVEIELDEVHFALECNFRELVKLRLNCGLSWWMERRLNRTYGELYKLMLQPTNEYLPDFIDGLIQMRDLYREALDLDPVYKF